MIKIGSNNWMIKSFEFLINHALILKTEIRQIIT